jgi:hypothetical protein
MDVCRLSCLIALLAMGAGTARAADEILVLGDSWGFATAPALQQVLDDNGHANVDVVNEAVPGDTAANLSNPTGLQGIGSDLAAHPDTVLVHLSIGGNDFLGSWSASMNPQQEDALFDGIVADIETIVLHIGSERPDVAILLPSYDYPRPLPLGTPLEVNTAAEELASRVQALADSISIHLTAEGYLLFADELFERFYDPALGSEVEAVPALPEAAGWILGLLLVATRAPSRAYMRRSARGRASAPSSAASL